MDSTVHGSLQARILEWVAFPFSRGIFPTQRSSPGLPRCRQILYQLSHKGSPRILEWVAYPFSRGSSPPRNWTWFSCIIGGFFTNWAIRKAQKDWGWKCLRPVRILCPWGFSRQKYWSGLLCSSTGNLPNLGTESGSTALQVGILLSEPSGKPDIAKININ